jgi:hypothetical protein
MSSLPAHCVSFGEICDPQLPHDVQTLRAMVHAVCGNVNQSSAERFALRRVIEVIDEELFFRFLLRNAAAKIEQLFRNKVQTIRQFGNGIPWRSPARGNSLRLAIHQVTPAFHVCHNVSECSTERFMPDIEFAVELGV